MWDEARKELLPSSQRYLLMSLLLVPGEAGLHVTSPRQRPCTETVCAPACHLSPHAVARASAAPDGCFRDFHDRQQSSRGARFLFAKLGACRYLDSSPILPHSPPRAVLPAGASPLNVYSARRRSSPDLLPNGILLQAWQPALRQLAVCARETLEIPETKCNENGSPCAESDKANMVGRRGGSSLACRPFFHKRKYRNRWR